MTSSTDPLGVRSNDPVERYRADAEQREKEFARARAQREREQRRAAERSEAARLRLEFESRLAALERAHRDLYADVVGLARSTSEAIDVLADQRVDLSRDQREEPPRPPGRGGEIRFNAE